MAGAVGGASVLGGVVVAIPLHILPDDNVSDDDDDKGEVSVQDIYITTIPKCFSAATVYSNIYALICLFHSGL